MFEIEKWIGAFQWTACFVVCTQRSCHSEHHLHQQSQLNGVFFFPHTSWKLLMYNDKLLHFFMGVFFPTVLDFKPQLLENGCPSANQNTFAGFDYIMLVFPMKWSVCVYIEMLHFWSVLFASKCYQSQTGSLSPLNVMCTLLGWWFNCQS